MTLRNGKWLVIILLAGAGAALAQSPQSTMAGDILSQYYSLRNQWFGAVLNSATTLFWLLAGVEFVWAAILVLLERGDMQAWVVMIVRRIMFIGFWDAVLINGNSWVPALIDSFARVGLRAANISGPLSPSQIFIQGLDLVRVLAGAVSTSAFLTDPFAVFLIGLSCWFIPIAFALIAANYIITLVESYITLSVGFIFLGFGGSRWTVPYTERFVGMAVAVGMKILLLYCLISGGLVLTAQWSTEAAQITTSPSPIVTAADILGGSIILMLLCWQIPKLFSAVIAGAVVGALHDVLSPVTTLVGTAVAAATLGASAAGGLLGSGGGNSGSGNSGGGSGSGGSGGSGGGGSVGSALDLAVPPPSDGAEGGGGSGSGGSGGGRGGGPAYQAGYGVGRQLARTVRNFRINDHGGPGIPPRPGQHD